MCQYKKSAMEKLYNAISMTIRKLSTLIPGHDLCNPYDLFKGKTLKRACSRPFKENVAIFFKP